MGEEKMTLSQKVQAEVDRLLNEVDLCDWYKLYSWKEDRWETGFPNIFRLECDISSAAMKEHLGKSHAIMVAQWGGLPNLERISCREPLKLSLYVKGQRVPWLLKESENTIRILESQIQGFGPTYTSKFLRFAVPSIFGAIDTRIVRVFGRGDPRVKRYNLLSLLATQYDKRWAILSSQSGWPSEYGVWIAILHKITDELNKEKILCPHPREFTNRGLRTDGAWIAADVEMALFSYASHVIGGSK